MPNSTCSIAECPKAPQTRGWCGAHYSRWKRYGDPTMGGPAIADKPRVCIADDCAAAVRAWGWCRAHYRLWKAHGKPEYMAPKPPRMCSIEGCPNKHRTGGYCSSHNEYKKRHGTATPQPRPCSLCGTEFESVQSKQLMCSPCARYRQNTSHGVNPITLAKRDGNGCGLCGDLVDMSLSWPNPASPSVDHVIPWSLGGTHDLSNLQLAHLSCNCRKGNRVNAAVA